MATHHPAMITYANWLIHPPEVIETAVRSGTLSPYVLDPKDIHVPPSCIQCQIAGSIFPLLKPTVQSLLGFTAYINRTTGLWRIDNIDCPDFWIELNLSHLREVIFDSMAESTDDTHPYGLHLDVHPASISKIDLARRSPELIIQLIHVGILSPYQMQPHDIHISPIYIQGRVPMMTSQRSSAFESWNARPSEPCDNSIFTAFINRTTGVLRIDKMDNPSFWLELNLSRLLPSLIFKRATSEDASSCRDLNEDDDD
jgi:hypothetical protein